MHIRPAVLGLVVLSLASVSRTSAQSTALDTPPTVPSATPTEPPIPEDSVLSVLQNSAPPSVDKSVLSFDDGLKVPLPPGWQTTILDTKAAPVPPPGAPPLPPEALAARPLTLLMHAAPDDAKRLASIAIVRDLTGAGDSEATAKQKTLARLTEIAAERGYKVERISNKGRADSPNNIVLSEIYGVAGDGRRRIFTCVAVNRAQRPALRCYWQCDESDTVSRRQFDDLINFMTCDGVVIADILWSGAPMATPSTPAVVVTTSETRSTSIATATAPGVEGAISPATAELVAKYRDSLVVIEGENGTGSGFICKLDDKPWMMTNIHVMADNPKPRFTTMNGKALTLGPAFLGVDHDIFKGTLSEASTTLDVMKDIDSNAKIGDPIVVLGNPEGAGVIKPLEGRIVGIGPNLVEVDAPFVPGNSGSPIVHVATGKVIGIATYAIIRKVDFKDKSGVDTTIRRFGYRLDNVTRWEPVNWPVFYAQSAQASKIKATGEEFIELFKDARENNMHSTNYENPGIQRALQNLERTTRGNSRMSSADQSAVNRQLLSDLRVAAVADINAFDNRTAYDFFRRRVADEKKFRDDLYAGFTRLIDANR